MQSVAVAKSDGSAARQRAGWFHRLKKRGYRAKRPAALPTASPLRIGDYTIARIGPEEAGLIPDGFRRVYGENYLSSAVYDTEAIGTALRSGEQISFLARHVSGDFAGHIALRRSAPNGSIYEISQGIVVAEHRKAGIFRHIFDAALGMAENDPTCEALFGTALTNHKISQRVLSEAGLRDVGFEIDYVPQRMLSREGAAGPIATVVQYRSFGRGPVSPAYVSPALAGWVWRLLRTGGEAGPALPVVRAQLTRRTCLGEETDLPRFDMARLTLEEAGDDLPRLLPDFEQRSAAAGRRTAQVLIALDRPQAAAAIESLRPLGYAFSGLLPRYLPGSAHGALLYKSFGRPNFKEIQPYTEQASALLSDVVLDWHFVTQNKELVHESLPALDPASRGARTVPQRMA
ncbi:hypothetical protein ABWI00_11705 [Algihabitans albus]|uniref:hypothetical protein n=1 Tax=Algihabitans albus TaxID=2164067 RepID=UPI0035CF31C8